MNKDISIWENRYTVRKFSDQNRTVKQEDLEYLKQVITHVPTQCGIKQNIWLYLSDQGKDLEFRKWLLENGYWRENFISNHGNVKEYMLPIYQAPALLLSIVADDPYIIKNIDKKKDPEDLKDLNYRNEGIYIGVLLSELLHLGYQVGTFGCLVGFHRGNSEQKAQYFNQYIRENYGEEIEQIEKLQNLTGKLKFFPSVAIAFGPQGEISKETKVKKYKNYDYLSFKNTPVKKRTSNIINL